LPLEPVGAQQSPTPGVSNGLADLIGLRPVGLMGDLPFTDLLIEALGSFLPIFMVISSLEMKRPLCFHSGLRIHLDAQFQLGVIFSNLTKSA
jgi:hypothetical protein